MNINNEDAKKYVRNRQRIRISREGPGTIVGIRGSTFVVDLDLGGTMQIQFDAVGDSKMAGKDSYLIESKKGTSDKLQLLENKLRKMVREELMKEEYNASAEAKNLMSSCRQYIRAEIDLKLFTKHIQDTLDTIKYKNTGKI